jgi:hypothetical protein
MARRAIEVIHVGSSSRDLTPDDPRGWRLGGGVTYAALTTARLGLRTAVVVVPNAAGSTAGSWTCSATPAWSSGRRAAGDVFDNQETPEGRIQICHARGLPLAVPRLPDRWLAAGAWSIVPVAGEVGDDWAAVIPDGPVVAVGWQGLLRELVAGERVRRRAPRPSALVRRADLVAVSHHDVDGSTKLADLGRFLHPGAWLVVTQGGRGGLLMRIADDGPRDVVRYLPTATTAGHPTVPRHVPGGPARVDLAAGPRRQLATVERLTCGSRRRRIPGRGGAGLPVS